MWSCEDNQEVGVEAATPKRLRNSTRDKGCRADNVAGLRYTAEVVAFMYYPSRGLVPLVQGRGWVGERRVGSEAAV